MPLWLPPNALGKTQTNVTAADKDGTTITSGGTAHTKGAYSAGQLIASTDEDVYGITIQVDGVSGAATDSSYLLDIGIGASGSEVDLIQDLDCWGAATGATTTRGAKSWFFPVFIPKGTRIAARSQARAISDVANVAIWVHQAIDGWGMEVPTMWERLGAVTNSDGVSVTPASGAFGSWKAILDPITKNYRWWHVGLDNLNSTVLDNGIIHVELGIGESTASVSTIGSWNFEVATSETMDGPYPAVPVFQPLPDNDLNGIFARISSTSAVAKGVLVYAGE